MDKIKILIVDDHPVVRSGLQGMLSAQAGFEVIGEAVDGAGAVEFAEQNTPDVILMDLKMPGMDGVSAISKIKASAPEIHILVLTTYDSDADIMPAIEAGATGYLLKDTPRDDLFRAIRSAANGESVLAPTVAARLMGRMRAPAEEALTSRELEVLELLAEGLLNKEIAQKLHISEATVKTHLLHIYAKLNVDGRTAAVTEALKRGILRLEG
jgi:DNA-binding NarL/FixJ family response regulator